MEGAVVFGLSLEMAGRIKLEQGQVVQSNFDYCPVMRIGDCPKIQVELIQSRGLSAGVALIAPVLVNAIYAASGKRIRKLPIKLT